MKAVHVITGTGVPLKRSDVDTDQIIPADWLKRVERTGFDKGLFSTWRDDRDFVLNDERYAQANILVAGPAFGVGAVYLYRPNRTLISRLTGTTSNDWIGQGGIFVLPSGNFLVVSGAWDNGTAVDAGAVTFVNGQTGLNGTVSAANSLVGSSAGDRVGSGNASPDRTEAAQNHDRTPHVRRKVQRVGFERLA